MLESCAATSSVADASFQWRGAYTFVGVDAVDVGGTPVPTYHYSLAASIAGAAHTGSDDIEWWFSASDGLPVKLVRHTRASSISPVGPVQFSEDVSWSLRSLTPDPPADAGAA